MAEKKQSPGGKRTELIWRGVQRFRERHTMNAAWYTAPNGFPQILLGPINKQLFINISLSECVSILCSQIILKRGLPIHSPLFFDLMRAVQASYLCFYAPSAGMAFLGIIRHPRLPRPPAPNTFPAPQPSHQHSHPN